MDCGDSVDDDDEKADIKDQKDFLGGTKVCSNCKDVTSVTVNCSTISCVNLLCTYCYASEGFNCHEQIFLD